VGTAVVGEPSPELPQPGVLTMPVAYPPRSIRDGTVLVEIELTAAAMATGHRVLSPPSGFDSAALETVRGWRFGFPTEPTGAAQLFAYALVGFREPITR
jgi:TonB family protein